MKLFLLLLANVVSFFSFGQDKSYAGVLHDYTRQHHFNGAVLIATNGHIDYSNGVGLANRQRGTSINAQSKFKICSITKTFTAVLILQLVEEGKADLKATIGRYLPDYTGEGKDSVTLENLLTYSSGIPNCESYIGDTIYKIPIARDRFISRYCSGKLESKPGTKFNYDNGAYIILGKIVEAITKKSFAENLQRRILHPLHMQNTGMLSHKEAVAGLVASYMYNDSLKTFAPDPFYYIENFYSAGAMYSTVEDLLKFDQGIFTYVLLKKPTVDLLLTPHKNLDNVGLGFWVSDGYGLLNTRFAYRPGGIYGSATNWIHLLDANKAIIVFSNTDATNLFEMSQQLNGVAVKASKQ